MQPSFFFFFLESEYCLSYGKTGNTKLATCFPSLLQNRLNSDVARYIYHPHKTCLATDQIRLLTGLNMGNKTSCTFFCCPFFRTFSALRAAKPQRLNSGCDFPLEVARSRFRLQLSMCNNKSFDQSTLYYNLTQKSNLVKEQVKKEKTRTNMEMTPLLQDDLDVIGEDHALASQDLPNVRRECRYYYVS